MQKEKTKFTPKDMAYIALLVVLIAVCYWISIPSVVPFTMQTFGVFCAVGLLGGFRGTVAVLIYILMGLIGLPVFSNFNGGAGYLMGPTGGYIVGFLFTALIYWLFEKLFGKSLLCRRSHGGRRILRGLQSVFEPRQNRARSDGVYRAKSTKPRLCAL